MARETFTAVALSIKSSPYITLGNNVVGATIFPHNIGLGATREADLVRRIADVTRKEVRATGISWTFAPCVAVARDKRWGRTYESFSESAALVSELGQASIEGLQGSATGVSSQNYIAATAKHFFGDGGTTYGTGDSGYLIDQGDTRADDPTLRAIHLEPYKWAVKKNVSSIMISYSSINGLKMHGFKYWITDVLRGELGFNGVIVSDWAGIDQVDPDYATAVRTSINAGVDMNMVPSGYAKFISTLKAEVLAGRVSEDRIDEAVTRIIQMKQDLKLFEYPFADRTLLGDVGSPTHRALAREAVWKSQVLLKKSDKDKQGNTLVFPLPKTGPYSLMVAGKSADNMGLQLGGWSISWQGGYGAVTPGTTVLQGIKSTVDSKVTVNYISNARGNYNADYGIAIVGEPPYAEGRGDSSTLALPSEDVSAITTLCSKVKISCTVVILSGRPLIIPPATLDLANVWIFGGLPGTQGEGIADVLFGIQTFQGKLSMTWPKLVSQEPLNFDDPVVQTPQWPYGHAYGP